MGISNEIEVAMIAIDEATIIVIPIKFGISHPMMAKKSAKKCAVRVFVNFAYQTCFFLDVLVSIIVVVVRACQ